MSIGTAMVVIAMGVFFYLKPQAFKVSAKVGAIALGLGLLAVGAYYGIYKYREANGDAQKLADYIRQLQPKDAPDGCKSIGNAFDQFDEHPRFQLKCADGNTYYVVMRRKAQPKRKP